MAHTDPAYRSAFNDALDQAENLLAEKSTTAADSVPMQTLSDIFERLRKAEPRHLEGIDAE